MVSIGVMNAILNIVHNAIIVMKYTIYQTLVILSIQMKRFVMDALMHIIQNVHAVRNTAKRRTLILLQIMGEYATLALKIMISTTVRGVMILFIVTI